MYRNNSTDVLRKYRAYLTMADRRFLASVSRFNYLTWAQRDVISTIVRRAVARRRWRFDVPY